MSKSISLSHTHWDLLYDQLKKDVPITTLMIRSRMKDKLGFTNRDHLAIGPDNKWKTTVELDFYDESKRTMFLLKYSEFLRNCT